MVNPFLQVYVSHVKEKHAEMTETLVWRINPWSLRADEPYFHVSDGFTDLSIINNLKTDHGMIIRGFSALTKYDVSSGHGADQ